MGRKYMYYHKACTCFPDAHFFTKLAVLLISLLPNQVLHAEARRKNIVLDEKFSRYFDLRQEFAKATGSVPKDLPDMFTKLSYQFTPGTRNGLNECRNIAIVVEALLRKGRVLNGNLYELFFGSFYFTSCSRQPSARGQTSAA